MSPPVKMRWLGLNAVLLAAVMFSAVAVIDSSHRCRMQYASLQSLQSDQWGMQEEWGRLLLEHSTWAAHHRVEQLARRELGMHTPANTELRVVLP